MCDIKTANTKNQFSKCVQDAHVHLFAIRPTFTKPIPPLPEHLFVCVSTRRVGVLIERLFVCSTLCCFVLTENKKRYEKFLYILFYCFYLLSIHIPIIWLYTLIHSIRSFLGVLRHFYNFLIYLYYFMSFVAIVGFQWLFRYNISID